MNEKFREGMLGVGYLCFMIPEASAGGIKQWDDTNEWGLKSFGGFFTNTPVPALG